MQHELFSPSVRCQHDEIELSTQNSFSTRENYIENTNASDLEKFDKFVLIIQ